ncbi:MAG TPA: hypothetical protein PLO89_07360 [Spirochaetota bacterium]|nr:hypothetical protein [Spirochaetota bacterium]
MDKKEGASLLKKRINTFEVYKKKALFFSKVFVFIILSNFSSNLRLFSDSSNDIIDKIPDFMKADKKNNNFIFNITNQTALNINDKGNLIYNYPSDLFYPYDNLIIQANYFFPINKTFSIGPSFFNDNYFKIFHNENSLEVSDINLFFNTVILGGLSFKFTPYHSKLKIPILLFTVDFGPGIEINNNSIDGDGLRAKFGGFNSLAIVLPIFPINLFIFDVNIFSILASDSPLGWVPGLALRNILLVRFDFTNFFSKKIALGLKLKNSFNFTLTGKPVMGDLESQYAYDRLELYLYYKGIKGLEFAQGYGFEYITFARDPDFYLAHKIVSEISYKINFFKISFNHSINFFSKNAKNGYPINKFEIFITISNMNF